MENAELINADYYMIGAAFAMVFLGWYVLGSRDSDRGGVFKTGLWDATDFGMVAIFGGVGVLLTWFARNAADGQLNDMFGGADAANDIALYVGVFAGIAFTVAVWRAVKLKVGPKWIRNIVGVAGWGLLFASGITTTVQHFYTPDFAGEFLFVSMPLFPMEPFLSSIWAATLLTLCGAAFRDLVKSSGELVE
jgi:hypothetical protein